MNPRRGPAFVFTSHLTQLRPDMFGHHRPFELTASNTLILTRPLLVEPRNVAWAQIELGRLSLASSFFALLDDIAVLARAAAASVDDVVAGASAASAKATGVVIDDAAVTPQYVQGISPKRELPVVWRIAKGSLLNKAIIIAVILPLSIFLPAAIPWILIVGGSYLAFEGAEKVAHWWTSRGEKTDPEEVIERTEADENQIVGAALRTDVVLSAEIMLISLAALTTDSWVIELATLILVAVLMTVGVYGVVGLLIKLDDVGEWLAKKPSQFLEKLGIGVVKAMPWVFWLLTIVGVIAMLWIGGQIVIENVAAVGWHAPHDALVVLQEAIGGPAALTWTIGTLIAALVGLAWGLALVGIFTAGAKVVSTARQNA